MASRPVVETRFSFLLTAAAVTLSMRMQFHLPGKSEREREKGGEERKRKGSATFRLREKNTQSCVLGAISDTATMLLKKSAN